MPAAPTASSRLRLRVSPAAQGALRSGHPWLFADAIREQNRPGKPGELAVVYDRQDKFLAVGLFDPESPIRLRVLQVGKAQLIDESWWAARLAQAIAKRDGLFDARTTGCRLIYGESDGWPGLVLDRYDSTLVVKLYTAAWLPWLATLLPLWTRELLPERVVLRLSRNIQESAAKLEFRDGQVLHGQPVLAPVVFLENGLRFEADVVRGQKTGFFLDQRENRSLVEGLAAGRNVLNTFSFSGGFSLYAARGGARAVTDVDISAHALASSNRNFALNADLAPVAACRHTLVKADTFAWLAERPAEKYSLIILDPPSLARRAPEKSGALLAYSTLAGLAIERLERGGILLACSCSAHVTADRFNAIRHGAGRGGRKPRELRITGHPLDHAAAFKEAEYLKAIYLKF